MMDTLVYFVHNFANGTCFLIDCGETLDYRGRLTLEIFELYIILLPFY
jgi:hypothetical protein